MTNLENVIWEIEEQLNKINEENDDYDKEEKKIYKMGLRDLRREIIKLLK